MSVLFHVHPFASFPTLFPLMYACMYICLFFLISSSSSFLIFYFSSSPLSIHPWIPAQWSPKAQELLEILLRCVSYPHDKDVPVQTFQFFYRLCCAVTQNEEDFDNDDVRSSFHPFVFPLFSPFRRLGEEELFPFLLHRSFLSFLYPLFFFLSSFVFPRRSSILRV